MVPVGVPEVAVLEAAEVAHPHGSTRHPAGAVELEPLAYRRLAGALDQPAADGTAGRQPVDTRTIPLELGDLQVTLVHGSPRKISRLQPGTCFGEMAVLAGVERNVPAGARVLGFEADALWPLSRYPEAWRLVVQATPLYQGVDLIRSLAVGAISPILLVHVAYLLVVGFIGLFVVSRRLDKLLLQ